MPASSRYLSVPGLAQQMQPLAQLRLERTEETRKSATALGHQLGAAGQAVHRAGLRPCIIQT